MARHVRVAGVQIGPIVNEPSKTVDKALFWLDKAADAGIQLAVFPECYYPDYSMIIGLHELPEKEHDVQLDVLKSLAEPIPGPTSERVTSKAEERKIHVVFTMLEKDVESNLLYNASILISSQGRILNTHRKTLLTPNKETSVLTPGDELNVTQTELGKIGQLICADSSCPESARILAIKGAELICLSVGSSYDIKDGREYKVHIFESCHSSTSRALDNNIFLVTVNLTGHLRSFEFFGKSRIISPTGYVLVQGGEGIDKEMLVTADIDLDERLPEKQPTFCMIDRRRPEIYGEILLANSKGNK